MCSLVLQANNKYDRKSFRYNSYATKSKIGFYTGKVCKTNIDHVVSLKDAHDSGAFKWNKKKKKIFSNDKKNHVPSCIKINSSKGASTPSIFLKKSIDKKGLDYKIVSLCQYLKIYYSIKKKYNLKFDNNNSKLFLSCLIDINKAY